MNQEMILKLRAPFAFSEVEAKIQVTNGEKTQGMAVFYLDARAIQNRLDDVLTPFGWKNQFADWKSGQAQLCGIAVYDSERGEWIGKFDAAENSEIEAIKGGISDAFKRTACVWGVGRYLYGIEPVWVDIEPRGKGYVIKNNQMGILKAAYEKAVARIFGKAPAPAQTVAPAPVQQAPAPVKQTAPAPAASPEPVAEETPPEDVYTVKTSKQSGKSSQFLEIIDGGGKQVSAYIQVNPAVSVGSRLTSVKIETKNSERGDYNILSDYQVAA